MKKYMTVAQFNEVINIHLQTIGVVEVVGEITEKRISRNSGLMMTIKDEKESSILKLSGFAPRVKGVNSVDVGMKVVASGVPQLYGPFGAFSLQVVSLTPYGEGSLKAAFEKLKKLLGSKGYFAPDRKRNLPEFVTRIALITADESAAYTDFMKILKENQASLDIDFYPVHVQGKYAVDEIIRALKSASKTNVDAVVLTRGGGSLEDLIAFNDEQVADAIFASSVPVISAVGHERDTSISDLVADIVASTPSQAAYYLAQHNAGFLDNLVQKVQLIEQNINTLLTTFDFRQDLAHIDNLIRNELRKYDYKDKLGFIDRTLNNQLSYFRREIEAKGQLLNSYNPKSVLKRGYAAIKSGNSVIRSIKEVEIGQDMSVRLIDGKFESKVIKIN